MTYKIMLWGIGAVYNKIYNVIKYFELTNQIQIIGITAQEIPVANKLDGYNLIRLENISDIKYDYIIVLSDTYFNEIVKIGTSKYNIDRRIMINYKVLLIPNIELNQYFNLYESKLTILSNNCWGGLVYHSLGLECCSPLKNMFLSNEDYLKVISDLQYYISQIPEYKREEIDIHSGKKYPVLALDDVELHCNHSDTSDMAIRDWMRRAKKVNYTNIFCEMYTENGDIAARFGKLEKYKKKICFVPWKERNRYEMHLDLGINQTEFYQSVNSNAALGGNAIEYNLVELLLGNIRRRVL